MLKSVLKIILKIPFEILRALGVLEKSNGAQVLRHQELLEYFNTFKIKSNARILDVGCGDGGFLSLLKTDGYIDLNGCDWRPARNDEYKYTIVDLNKDFLSVYADASFDIIVSSDVIEHLENPAQTLREFHRVLKPQGLALITIPNSWNLLERIYFMLSANSNRYKSERRSPAFGHISFFTSEIIESLIDRAQLKLISDTYGSAYFNQYILSQPRSKLLGYNYMFVLQKA
jgi:2-polyprenyl-3-methyl-5-hydroxy-6-metoxy-1,4-benzoquinol methylase